LERKILRSKQSNTKSIMDGVLRNKRFSVQYQSSLESVQELLGDHRNNPYSSILFSRGKRTRFFYTSDSRRYISPQEAELARWRVRRYEVAGKFDSVHARFVSSARADRLSDPLFARLREKYFDWKEALLNFPNMLRMGISPVRVWNASIVGAIFFGMFSMTLIYRYFGQQVFADDIPETAAQVSAGQMVVHNPEPFVLGAQAEKPETAEAASLRRHEEAARQARLKQEEQAEFEREVRQMVKGYPIEKMLPYIVTKDRTVAAFLIGIAKKESNWGKRVPVLHGKDCYNYWGYRGIRERMGTGGHTCFNSPQDAVDTVARRIETLVKEEKLTTPDKMVIWKCGYTCAGHSRESVRKWIADVDMYFQELSLIEE
jgi:hypothetical protein